VLIDVDVKAMPDAVRQRMDELGGALKALAIVLPTLGRVAHVVRRSTSSGLYRLDTGVTTFNFRPWPGRPRLELGKNGRPCS
jgi:hypothetical protein